MALLVLDREAQEVRAESRHLAIYEKGRRHYTVPLRSLDRVVLHGRVMIDSRVFNVLAREGVGMVALDPRHPEGSAELVIDGRAFNRRMAQWRRARDRVWRDAFAQRVVYRKLLSQWRVLQRFWSVRPDLRRRFYLIQRGFPVYLEQVRDHPCDDKRARAIEGGAARVWFEAYQCLFPEALGFTGRNRRPPRDPVNVVLSLSYTLLYGEGVNAVRAVGLDPAVGFFHVMRPDRQALALDLMEPLRPWVDHWVWRLFATRRLRADHFSLQNDACYLGEAGRERYYHAWGRRRHAFARTLRAYARVMGRMLITE